MANDQNSNQYWLARDALTLPRQFHNLPKHLECFLPKCDLESSKLSKDHVNTFILTIRLMNIQFEYVVCHVFSYTFENLASTWYFNFHVGSITNWSDFQKAFIKKFKEETTTSALMEKLFSLVMGPKEKVKDFNQ